MAARGFKIRCTYESLYADQELLWQKILDSEINEKINKTLIEQYLAFLPEVENKQAHAKKLDELVRDYLKDVAPWYLTGVKEVSYEDLTNQWEAVFGKLDSPEVKAELQRIEIESKKPRVTADTEGPRYI